MADITFSERVAKAGAIMDGQTSDATINAVKIGKGASNVLGNLMASIDGMQNITTGAGNTGVGYQALKNLTIGNSNTVLGYQAGLNLSGSGDGNTVSALNTFVGSEAGGNTTTGASNTAIGQKALNVNAVGSNNVAIGKSTAANTVSSENTYLGSGAGEFSADSGTGRNVAVGRQAGNRLTGNAAENTYIGYAAGNTSGNNNESLYNVGLGAYTLQSLILSTHQYNVAVGYRAMRTAACEGAVAIGYEAGFAIATRNICIGRQAGRDITGSNNIVIGESAGTDTTQARTLSNSFIAGSAASGGSARIDNVYFGRGAFASAPSNYTINGTGGAGTDIAGGNLTIAGGKATGNAVGGSIVFSTSNAGSTGTTLQSLTQKAILTSLGYLGIGTTPGALLDVDASTTTRASIRVRSGTAPTSPNDGDIWFDGSALYIRISGVTKSFNVT